MNDAKKPTLYLLDAMALVYRAYYAFLSQRLQTKSGFPTGATFGFIVTVNKILEKYKPDYFAIAFDSKEKTFRHETYLSYKANRPEPPEDLTMQIGKIIQLVEAYGFKMIKMPGYEADDIIGTLARRYENECNVFIVTPDKDFSQLVHDGVKILKPGKEDDAFDLFGREEIKTKHGVYPEQFIDYLTLMGDTSDNVPGVDGVGPKTAANLINQYQTVENLYKHIGDITKFKLKQNLLDAKEHLKVARFLVTIKLDVPDNTTLSEMRLGEPNAEKLLPLLEELEFRHFLQKARKQLGVTAPIASDTNDDAAPIDDELSFDFGANVGESITASALTKPHENAAYHLVSTQKEFEALLETLVSAREFSLDTETTALDTFQAELVAMSFSVKPKEAYVAVFGEGLPREATLERIQPLLENPHVRKVMQNGKFDMLVLKNHGITLVGVSFDTMLASYVLNPDKPHNMDDMAKEHLRYRTTTYEELVGTGKAQKKITDVPLTELVAYAGQDADVTLQLKDYFLPHLAAAPALSTVFADVEMPLMPVLAAMEQEGIRIDTAVLKEISKTIDAELITVTKEIFDATGFEFNIDSPKQLAEALFEKLKLPAKKRTKTGFSTDVRVLEELSEEFPVAIKILDYRSLQKLKGTYVDALPEQINPKTNRIHTSFNQSVAATGRLSSTNPNLQNIPIRTETGRQIRKAFIPSHDGHLLLSADYSQVELRIAAELSGDETMLAAFDAKEDIHTATARVIFSASEVTKDQRRKAKEVNFGVLYGLQAFGLAQRLDISNNEAKSIIENYKQKYPSIFRYTESVLDSTRKNGYIETLSGRRRYFPEIKNKNPSIRNANERAAINTPIQGTAADMIKHAMIDIHAELQQQKFKSRLILQVHDELLFDADPNEVEKLSSLAKSCMIRGAVKAGLKRVPIEVEIGTGKNWLDAH
jgi:DNA polymerase I